MAGRLFLTSGRQCHWETWKRWWNTHNQVDPEASSSLSHIHMLPEVLIRGCLGGLYDLQWSYTHVFYSVTYMSLCLKCLLFHWPFSIQMLSGAPMLLDNGLLLCLYSLYFKFGKGTTLSTLLSTSVKNTAKDLRKEGGQMSATLCWIICLNSGAANVKLYG
jgi:hypothetical protein